MSEVRSVSVIMDVSSLLQSPLHSLPRFWNTCCRAIGREAGARLRWLNNKGVGMASSASPLCGVSVSVVKRTQHLKDRSQSLLYDKSTNTTCRAQYAGKREL